MQIAFDIRKAAGQYTGVGLYIVNLLRALREVAPQHGVRELFDVRGATGLRANPAFAELLWKQIAAPFLLRGADVFFVPNPPVALYAPCPTVLTIHDMAFCAMSAGKPPNAQLELYRYSARRARRVITDSQSSKRDIMRFLDVPEEKIRVIPPACDSAFHRVSREEALARTARLPFVGNAPFILSVPGTISGHKGVFSLVEAFLALPADLRKTHRLVIVGKTEGEGYRRVCDMLASMEDGQRVCITGYLDAALLPALYSAAVCMVYPSLYEGFGLPPLESMTCGTPVITTHVSSLPEVTGEAAEYVGAGDTKGLRDAMERLLRSPERQGELSALGLRRAKLFSWEKNARELLGVFQECLVP